MTVTLPLAVEHVHDGDTLTGTLTLAALGPAADASPGYSLSVVGGMLKWRNRCRLLSINAPELATPDGRRALAYVQGLVQPGTELTLSAPRTVTDQYGRVLGDWLLPDGRSVSTLLLAAGLAVPMHGKALAELAGIGEPDATELLLHAAELTELLEPDTSSHPSAG